MYVPFICTCIGMVMLFYIISYLHYSDTIASMNGGLIMRSTLNLGSIVVGIFSCIFLFYTNSFLIRRRKKEYTDRTALPECGDYDFHKRLYLYSQRVMESLPR